jgi:hypothetical protein
MAGHIHDSDPLATGQVQPGKPQFNGDAPAFLFFEAIRVDACQGPDQAGFAMVNVAGSAENNLFQ